MAVKNAPSKPKQLASIAATGIAAYVAFRVFKKQQPMLNGFFDKIADGVTHKTKR